jgi:hypothetical protein
VRDTPGSGGGPLGVQTECRQPREGETEWQAEAPRNEERVTVRAPDAEGDANSEHGGPHDADARETPRPAPTIIHCLLS